MYHSRVIKSNCFFAKAGSIIARGIQWKAVSQLRARTIQISQLSGLRTTVETHVANQGYSHLSGIDRMSLMYMCFQSYNITISLAVIKFLFEDHAHLVSDPLSPRRRCRLTGVSLDPLFLDELVVLLGPVRISAVNI